MAAVRKRMLLPEFDQDEGLRADTEGVIDEIRVRDGWANISVILKQFKSKLVSFSVFLPTL